jgi:hypothetical protein
VVRRVWNVLIFKVIDPRVFTRMLWKDGRREGRKDGRTDGSVDISLRNFVGEGIISWPEWDHKSLLIT